MAGIGTSDITVKPTPPLKGVLERATKEERDSDSKTASVKVPLLRHASGGKQYEFKVTGSATEWTGDGEARWSADITGLNNDIGAGSEGTTSDYASAKKAMQEWIESTITSSVDVSKHGGNSHDQKTHGRRKSAGEDLNLRTVDGPEGIAMQMGRPIARLASKHGVKKNWESVRAVGAAKRAKTAAAYDAMPVMDDSEETLKTWDLVASVVEDQFTMLTKELGIKVVFTDTDPYESYHDMLRKVEQTGVLEVLRTEATGGHPYWPNEVNDKFRAVHDAFGHLATGRGFDRHGEEAAFQAHRSMFPEEAWPALATELRGQNQFLLHTGEFGEQKIGFLPVELQKRLSLLLSKAKRTADDDNAYDKGGSHHVSCGRHFAKVSKHGTHDQKTHGRRKTATGGGVKPKIRRITEAAGKRAKQLAAMARDGGFTFNPKRSEMRSKGVAVAVSKENERKVRVEEFSEDSIRQYARDHAELLAQPRHHLGAWREIEKGVDYVYLDVSVVMPSLESAADLGRANDQISIFDLSTFTTHYRAPDKEGNLKYIPLNLTDATGYDRTAATDMATSVGKADGNKGVMFVPGEMLDESSLPKIVERIMALKPIGKGEKESRKNS